MTMKSLYAVKDDIACILIDNQISLEDMRLIFNQMLQEKKDGCYDEDYSVK